VLLATTLVCSNCGGGSGTAIVVAAITAGITFAVAVATLLTGLATRKAAAATAQDASASRELVGVTRQQFRHAQMPVVTPIADTGELGGMIGATLPPEGEPNVVVPRIDPRSRDRLLIPVANVGVGPA
jgi:hypothetical protein